LLLKAKWRLDFKGRLQLRQDARLWLVQVMQKIQEQHSCSSL